MEENLYSRRHSYYEITNVDVHVWSS